MKLGEAVSERFDKRNEDLDQAFGWRKEHIERRLNRLTQIPLQAVAQLGDLVIGTSVILVGRGRKQIDSGGDIAADLFLNVLRVINPEARLKGDVDDGKGVRLLSQRLIDGWKVQKLANSDNILTRHVVARAAYLSRGILLVLTRVVDLAVGVFAMGCALLSFGQDEEINSAAYEGLKAPRLAGDLLETLLFVINPNWD